MAQFNIEIAQTVFAVRSLFESTKDYCRNYLTEKEPDFTVEVFPEDLISEQQALDVEAAEEGLKRRKFTDPFLERTVIQRKVAACLLHRNTLLFHGSGLSLDGQGYLFTAAKCGTGKSTHTRFWRQVFGDRVKMVNDDKPFLHLTESGVTMYGAPWSGKHGLDTNVAVPLRGICLLQRGPENRIEKISPEEALPMLLHQAFLPGDDSGLPVLKELTEALCRKTTLWKMECINDPSAAEISAGEMACIK